MHLITGACVFAYVHAFAHTCQHSAPFPTPRSILHEALEEPAASHAFVGSC